MSNTWITHIYFPQYTDWPVQLIDSLVDHLRTADLVFPADESGSISRWFSHTGGDHYPVRDIDAALELTAQRRGGIVNLINLATDMHVFLHLCLEGDQTYPAESAEAKFGFIGLSVQYAYLHDEPSELMGYRYQSIFKWSQIISEMPGAIYGWGDLETQVIDMRHAVVAADLNQKNIPRLSWWSYYSAAFVSHVGSARLSSASNWRIDEGESGLIIIARPPGELGDIPI